jgi:putative mRNA 3-end processing factor
VPAQLLARRAERDGKLYVTDAVARVNEAIESHVDVEFGAGRWSAGSTLEPGDVLVRPGSPGNADARRVVESSGAVTVGLSGWALTGRFQYDRGFDAAFPLSDHCDFEELIRWSRASTPTWCTPTTGSRRRWPRR